MPQTINVLFIGDIVGNPGRHACKTIIPRLKEQHGVDVVIANGENAAHGSGLTRKIVDELCDAGIHILTTGDHVYRQADVYEYLRARRTIVRPLNFAPDAIGVGSTVFSIAGVPVGVINLLGHVFIQVDRNPFLVIEEAVAALRKETSIIFVDMHAEATSEKIAMGWLLDGRVSGVFGTHTHVQTADERILPKGTAYITDAGMTGPFESVIGREIEPVLKRFCTSMPSRFSVAKEDVRLSGVIATVDVKTGLASQIVRVQESL